METMRIIEKIINRLKTVKQTHIRAAAYPQPCFPIPSAFSGSLPTPAPTISAAYRLTHHRQTARSIIPYRYRKSCPPNGQDLKPFCTMYGRVGTALPQRNSIFSRDCRPADSTPNARRSEKPPQSKTVHVWRLMAHKRPCGFQILASLCP